MTKVDIISGFLGAGKTTLIKKLIKEVFAGQKVVLIENEFGEIGVDGGFLKDAGINVTEMNSGCICCSLVGDFAEALKKVIEEYHPDRVIIEPSGVGKLSDVSKAVMGDAKETELEIATTTAVVDAKKAKVYMKNFGEFFNDQIETARTIILSRTQNITDDKLEEVVALMKEKNADATIITTPWDDIDGKAIFSAMSDSNALERELMLAQEAEHEHHHHHYDEDGVCSCGHHHDDEDEHEHHHHHDEDEHEHHHHYDEDGVCSCGHHHDDDDEHEHHHHHDEDEHEHHHHHDEDEHEHHHHHDEDEHEHHHHDEDEHEHHHHYDENGVCSCGHHHGDGHHHHHADDVFTSWGAESPKKFDENELTDILEKLAADGEEYGHVLRSKGIVPGVTGEWLHFDLTPGEYEIRKGSADYTGRICVIGAELKEDKLKSLFAI